jgi:hypothetical protein
MGSTTDNPDKKRQADQFADAAKEKQVGLLREFWDFLRYNKKWWITPIVIVLLLVGVLVYVSATMPGLSPFICVAH